MFSRFLLVAGCATTLSLMPVMSSGFDAVPDSLSTDAHAQGKSGSSNAGGNGGGNGGGNSGGSNAGGNGGGHGASASAGGRGNGGGNGSIFGGGKGTTQSASARGNGGGNGQAQTIGELFGNFLRGGGKPEGAGQKAAKAPKANGGAPATRAAKAPAGPKAQKQAALPREVPVPSARPTKERNFRAKLAGLNSLNRNYHAYLNSNDPRMTAVRAYVLSSAEYDMTFDAYQTLQGEIAISQDAFNALVEGIEPYDDYTYDETTVEALEARLETLNGVDTTEWTDEELAAYNAERDALMSVLASEELASLQESQEALSALETELAALEGEITDEALTEALLAAANPNRLAEYGAENYVDEEMLNWAKSLLGVGEEDGKIDEVRTVLESEETQGDEILVDEVETEEAAG